MGVGEAEALRGQFSIEAQVEVVEGIPIVVSMYPCLGDKGDVVLVEGSEGDIGVGYGCLGAYCYAGAVVDGRARVRGCEDTGVGMEYLLYGIDTLLRIHTILYADCPIDTAQGLGGDILDIAAEEGTVGEDDDLVVGGENLCGDDSNLHDDA